MCSESRHHFRLKRQTARQAIQELAERAFLVDWCYPNPKKPERTELCVLLVERTDLRIALGLGLTVWFAAALTVFLVPKYF